MQDIEKASQRSAEAQLAFAEHNGSELNPSQAHLFIGKLAWNNNHIENDVSEASQNGSAKDLRPVEIVIHPRSQQPELEGFRAAMIAAGRTSLNRLMELPHFELRELQAA